MQGRGVHRRFHRHRARSQPGVVVPPRMFVDGLRQRDYFVVRGLSIFLALFKLEQARLAGEMTWGWDGSFRVLLVKDSVPVKW